MKKFVFSPYVLAFFAISIVSTVFAQDGKYGADSVTCIQNISLYREYYKQKNYKDAYPGWTWIFKNCPASTENMYVDGPVMLKDFISKEKDPNRKKRLIDTLFLTYDQRIKYFGKEGYVLGRKGVDYYNYRPEDIAKAFEMLEKSITMQGKSSEAINLSTYMQLSTILENKKLRSKDLVVDDYNKVSEIIEFNIIKYTEEEESKKELVKTTSSTDKDGNKIESFEYKIGEGKIYIETYINGKFDKRLDINNRPFTLKKDIYVAAQSIVETYALPYLSCEAIVNALNEKFEENKNNIDWLRKATNMLSKSDCTSEKLFIDAATNLHKLEPSANSAAKLAKMQLSKNNFSEAIKLYKQAIDMETENSSKAQYYYEMAFAQLKSGQYSTARSSAQTAASLRSGWGKPILLIGDAYAASSKDCGEDDFAQKAVYWIAVDKYQQAKAVDPSVASEANNKIATYSKYFPPKSEGFFRNITEGAEYKIGCWINESTKARFQQ